MNMIIKKVLVLALVLMSKKESYPKMSFCGKNSMSRKFSNPNTMTNNKSVK